MLLVTWYCPSVTQSFILFTHYSTWITLKDVHSRERIGIFSGVGELQKGNKHGGICNSGHKFQIWGQIWPPRLFGGHSGLKASFSLSPRPEPCYTDNCNNPVHIRMGSENARLAQTIKSLEKDIGELKREIRGRDEAIGEKEKRIADLARRSTDGHFQSNTFPDSCLICRSLQFYDTRCYNS